jgi:hypothetical protein
MVDELYKRKLKAEYEFVQIEREYQQGLFVQIHIPLLIFFYITHLPLSFT